VLIVTAIGLAVFVLVWNPFIAISIAILGSIIELYPLGLRIRGINVGSSTIDRMTMGGLSMRGSLKEVDGKTK